tara:strand:- start:2027 stop:3316 length:1290 start_codon:yes stop_codon:yes gene_type:complete
MKTKIKKKDNVTRILEVTVPWESLEKDYRQYFKQQSSKYEIPGFRAGKVPVHIVKKNIGPAIEANFAESSLNKYYMEALSESKINPINQAQITDLDFKENNDLKFSAVFEVRPDFDLPKDYSKNIKVSLNKYLVSDGDIEHSLNELRSSQAKLENRDAAQLGYYVNADFQELDDQGIAIIGSKLENQNVRLGDAPFSGELSKLIIGKKVSDKVVVELPYGDNKISKFEMEIKGVLEQVLPELNNSFAKSVAPDLKTVEDLKSRLKENIEKNLDDDYKKRLHDKIIDYFVDKTKLEVPKSMVESFLQNLFENEKKNSKNQDINEKEFKDKMYPYAEKNVKWLFIRTQLVDVENINVSDSDVDKFIKDTIKANKTQENEIKEFYNNEENKNNLKSNLSTNRLFECLSKYAKIKITEKSTDELRENKNEKSK